MNKLLLLILATLIFTVGFFIPPFGIVLAGILYILVD